MLLANGRLTRIEPRLQQAARSRVTRWPPLQAVKPPSSEPVRPKLRSRTDAAASQRQAERPSCRLRIWKWCATVAVVGISVVTILGLQSVHHTRRIIDLSRKIQQRDQKIIELDRAQVALQRALDAQPAQVVRPNVQPALYAGPRPKPALASRL
jgi:hypothetical protein